MTWSPRLRTVLLGINLLILALPLGAISVLRLYENELIRRTEAELLAQGSFVAAIWHEAMLQQRLSPDYGNPIDPTWRSHFNPNTSFHYVPARLDISTDPVFEPAPTPRRSGDPDPRADRAGERITAALRRGQRTTLAGIRVVDHQGIVVATTRGELHTNFARRPEIRRALRGEHVSLLRRRVSDEPEPPLESISRGKRVRVFVSVPVVEGDRVIGAVVLSRTPVDVFKALYTNRTPVLVGAGALLFVVILVSALTSLTLSRPMRALIRQAKGVASGELETTTPLDHPGTREVAQLSQAITEMARTLAHRADYIKTFASNVSHEFKTPLTSLRGTVELMRDHLDEMTAEERERFLQILDSDTERLDRLVRRLLDLARADVLKPSDGETVIADHLGRLVDRYRAAGMTIHLDQDPASTTALMDPEVFESIVSNLLDNARQHGGADVEVTVSAAPDACGALLLRVADDGPGISAANQERVFRPFFTTARATGGSGLGLSIIRSLILAHGGTIEMRSSEGEGTEFVITLPSR
ncbi:MAG: hypothetical protein CMH57_13165 [Myxococcales bacterium]|nr:hypothetical protein [Myxococcales bacterium]